MQKPFTIDLDYTRECWTILIVDDCLLPRYYISTHGRLYDNQLRQFVKYTVDKDGYYMASITVNFLNTKYKKIRVHRWELLSFCYNPNFRQLQANHIDGNKQNLLISNLEWITPIGNTRHGWDNNLNPNRGIHNGNAKYDEATIRQICEFFDQGYTPAQMCDELGITDKAERMRYSATASSIYHGKTHREIAMQYNFMRETQVANRYSEPFAILVCKFLSDPNREFTYKEIMDLLDIDNDERLLFKKFVDDLVQGRTYKNITSQYDIKKPLSGKGPVEYLMR